MKFPIEEIYRRVAKIDALRNDTNSVIRHGSGFFYQYNKSVFFATKRDHIIIEERAFLPDSLVLHPNMEAKTLGLSGIALQLYDRNEKPAWRLLPIIADEMYVSIPVQDGLSEPDFTQCFLSESNLPKDVLLPVGMTALKIPVPTCVSLANYFFYSHKDDERRIRKGVEGEKRFRIYRKGFALDMLEMVLTLLEKNMSLMKSCEAESAQEDLSGFLRTHQSMVAELENIISQFGDVLDPSMLERVRNIDSMVKGESFLQDYFIVSHLIGRVLSQFGNNIAYLQ